ncbi:MAG: thioredoxin reductase, thioredoxin reductase (NADPH) [Candidatus Peregrinibacteria bacterium GW2011_GWE2_39_6]|nr:MAG: thioredoxin reductase, thioredoxin reductase (NADPH) [Candidatus Peregrinibacteria bacterium GW2011_GWF2_39_17]KKR25794.1 MAG: thioredoxin reductase, thioredoxin reductase (NADPH) [Candidatus Peregrinibacteria bacterium GW2011_GWE2_39_6]HCW32752.1 thioredoxin-disulfide reductase [Candidatus Peregrinibacteria bacterium]
MYDLIIIGSGVSGMGAAIYAGRFDLKTLVIGELPGGTITLTHLVENYPGFPSLSGLELAQNFQRHVDSIGVTIEQEKISKITFNSEKKFFELKTQNEKNYQTKSILLTTGTKHRKLGIKGEAEFTNKGVSYCATCDGPFFRDKDVIMVGGADSAVKESLLLAKYAQKVTIVYRGEKVRPEPINQKRMEETPNIEVITKSNLVEIMGQSQVEKVLLDTGQELKCQGVFIEIGRTPLTDLAKQLNVTLNEKSEVIINKASETNVPGFFAAGDCTNTDWKQAIIGVAEGCMGAYSAYQYVESLGGKLKKP